MYAVAKEHGDGEYYRENRYVFLRRNNSESIVDIHDIVHATEEEREQFRKTVAQNLASAFNMPELAKNFASNKRQSNPSVSDGELRHRETHSLLQQNYGQK